MLKNFVIFPLRTMKISFMERFREPLIATLQATNSTSCVDFGFASSAAFFTDSKLLYVKLMFGSCQAIAFK